MRMVALDLDGTLVDQRAGATRWAEEFVLAHRLGFDVAELANSLTSRRPKGEVFAELVQRQDLSLAADEVWADYRRRMPFLVTCTDADRAALGELREGGWNVGIVTNGMVDNQEGKASRLGCPLEGWMVGDSVEMDVMGGRAAGLRTALIAGGATDGVTGSADLIVSSVAEAAALILADGK